MLTLRCSALKFSLVVLFDVIREEFVAPIGAGRVARSVLAMCMMSCLFSSDFSYFTGNREVYMSVTGMIRKKSDLMCGIVFNSTCQEMKISTFTH